MSYVDLHLHLLPGVDDGSRTEADAIGYAQRMTRDGVTEATLTPHVAHPAFDVDVRSLPERAEQLRTSLAKAKIRLRLHLGGELHPSSAAELSPEELELVAQGPAGRRWVLLEVPFAGVDERFVSVAEAVSRRGFGLVIAHPERAAGLLGNGGLRLLRPLLSAGALLQVNVCSLAGSQGQEAQTAAGHLLRNRLAYVLASDAHPGRREHTLREGFELARQTGLSTVAAWQLTQANPRFLLESGISPSVLGRARPAWRSLPRAKVEAARQAASGPRRAAGLNR